MNQDIIDNSKQIIHWINTNHHEIMNDTVDEVKSFANKIITISSRNEYINENEILQEVLSIVYSAIYNIIKDFDILKGDKMKPEELFATEVARLSVIVLSKKIEMDNISKDEAIEQLKRIFNETLDALKDNAKDKENDN